MAASRLLHLLLLRWKGPLGRFLVVVALVKVIQSRVELRRFQLKCLMRLEAHLWGLRVVSLRFEASFFDIPVISCLGKLIL